MVRRIYDMGPYYGKILTALTYEELMNIHSVQERIRHLGFKSCRYTNDYWEIDEVEFTWFVLRFS
jgi:hypothetical protein